VRLRDNLSGANDNSFSLDLLFSPEQFMTDPQNADSTNADTNAAVRDLDPLGAAQYLADFDDAAVADALLALGPVRGFEVFELLPQARHARIARAAPSGLGEQWLECPNYEEGSVGRLMEKSPAVFGANTTIASAIKQLREIVAQTLVTYVFVVDADRRLTGVVAFREMLFAKPEQTLAEIMLKNPFSLKPETDLVDAMREVVTRHYPVYPVTDANGRLVGVVRGQVMFEQQAFEISAQAGSMVGVEKEERIATPFLRSLKFRHPWLQLNLFTAFIAAAVVGYFQGTIDKIIILAVFLPVLAGQSGNTGCQALAVTLRGMTLGELKAGRARAMVIKEAALGAANGALVGIIAGAGMYVMASAQGLDDAIALSIITWAAMVVSCMASGIAGSTVPLVLKRLGADPATASSIFLTTATDVASMTMFLGLATIFIL